MNPDKLLEKGKQVLAQTQAQGLTQFRDSTFDQGPISATTLSSSPRPFNVPPPPLPVAGSMLSASSMAVTEQAKLQKEQEQRLSEAQAGQSETKSKYQEVVDRITGVFSSRPELEKQAGLEDLVKSRDEYTSQIEALDREEDNLIKGLGSQPGTLEQKAQRESDIRRDFNFKKADLAILESAANRRFDTASNLINQKIQTQLEPLKFQLDLTKDFYNAAKDDLEEEDDRAFQQKIRDVERLFEEEKTNKQAIASIQLEALRNGIRIPPSVLSELNGAKDAFEATQILARNGISLMKPTSMSSLGTGNPIVDETVQTYADLLAQGKISLSNVPQNIRNSVVAASNGIINKPLSDTAIKEITQTQSAIQNLQSLKTVVQNNLQFVGPISGLSRFNPYSDARKAQAEIDRVRQIVGKALEGGVLRKEDEEKYKKILATLGDKPETAIYKIDSLVGQLERDLATYRANQAQSGRFVGESVSVPTTDELRNKYQY